LRDAVRRAAVRVAVLTQAQAEALIQAQVEALTPNLRRAAAQKVPATALSHIHAPLVAARARTLVKAAQREVLLLAKAPPVKQARQKQKLKVTTQSSHKKHGKAEHPTKAKVPLQPHSSKNTLLLIHPNIKLNRLLDQHTSPLATATTTLTITSLTTLVMEAMATWAQVAVG